MPDIPAIAVTAKTLPAAWEQAVIACWKQGAPVKTEYDKPEDPPSRDCTVMIRVEDPMAEPRIHRAFPAGLEDLEVYRQEVVDGVHDHWIAPDEGKWQYTYHERLFEYRVEGKALDQINYVIEKLSAAPFSRRAQAVTWKAWEDMGIHDPACLQRLWFRVLDGKLYCNCHMRSNDAYKAAYMNMFAFVDLQRAIAEKISAVRGETIIVGPYTHIADSFHIYGSYFAEFGNFLKTVEQRSFEDRVWDSSFAEPFFEEGKARLAREQAENG